MLITSLLRSVVTAHRTSPLSPEELLKFKVAITGLTSSDAIRRAAAHLLPELPANFGLAMDDVVALLQLTAVVAKDSDDAELSRFLRTGRLPDIVALTPRQMDLVRGGRLILTGTRGLAPATILATLCHDGSKVT
jgi:hypothetical protein